MFAILTWARAVFAVLVMTVLISPVMATPRSSSLQTRTTEADQSHVAEVQPPAGSPELGILLIIGIVGLLIFMAWLVSRVGDDNSPNSDGSII